MKTRAEIREYMRWLLNQHANNTLLTSDTTMFDLNKLVFQGYRKYAEVAKAFPVSYTQAAIAGIAEYHYAYFGAQAADSTYISTSARADNTTGFTIAAQPTQLSSITISIQNYGNTTQTGNDTTITVSGYGRGYRYITEDVTFDQTDDLTDIPDSGIVTKTTAKKFQQITSIVPSAAQPAQALPAVDWVHFAGLPAETPGERIFDLWHVEYDDSELIRASVHDLDRYLNTWRSADGGTPSHWLPWGAQTFRLWRTPTGTDTIRIDGWETPDEGAIASDADTFDCDDADAEGVIALWGCILATVKFPNDENALRRSPFYEQYVDACKTAYRRIHNSGDGNVQLGKYAEAPRMTGLTYDPTITNI